MTYRGPDWKPIGRSQKEFNCEVVTPACPGSGPGQRAGSRIFRNYLKTLDSDFSRDDGKSPNPSIQSSPQQVVSRCQGQTLDRKLCHFNYETVNNKESIIRCFCY